MDKFIIKCKKCNKKYNTLNTFKKGFDYVSICPNCNYHNDVDVEE